MTPPFKKGRASSKNWIDDTSVIGAEWSLDTYNIVVARHDDGRCTTINANRLGWCTILIELDQVLSGFRTTHIGIVRKLYEI